MRKIFFIVAAIIFALTGTVSAASSSQYLNNVGVIIIGGAEFKTEDFYKAVQNEIKPSSGAKLIVGNDLQTRYKKYWLNRGYIGEQTPQKSDLIGFTAMSGCNKVVCLIVSDSVVDKHNNAKRREKDRVSLQLDAYLCTRTNVVDLFAATCEENSKTSSLRARRGAFKKCLEQISKSLNRAL